ncbi:MAG: nitroreductase family protein [Candidatus Aenigmatarchaeota archaeon]|nr:nitroreductase family protein [Candidatus Aenigmarchaeota archaeon]
MPFKAIGKFARGKRPMMAPEAILPEVKPVYDIVMNEIKKRASIRKYSDVGVSAHLVNMVLEAARYAPSEGDSQPWEFVVVRDPELKQHIVEAAYQQKWMLQAPVFIIACNNVRISRAIYGERGERLYGIQSVAAATQNMLIAAEALGLGTCWVGSFSEPHVSALLHLPEWIRPAAIITLGWPAERPAQREPHKLDDIVHYERYGETPLHRKVVREKTALL